MATSVAVFALVLAYLAVVGSYIAMRTLAKLRRDTHLLARGTRGPHGQQSLIEVTQRHAETTAAVAEQLEQLRAHVDATADRLAGLVDAAGRQTGSALAECARAEAAALRHTALVRYDAFGEMSGRMSFSLALLDEHGDGVTISAITGRTDTRVYAKAVSAGTSEQQLSPEESQAVAAALGERPAAAGRDGLRRAG